MKKNKNEQEKFWEDDFGDKYIQRNNRNELIESNYKLFLKIRKHLKKVRSIIEFGSNIGLNLLALKKISNNFNLTGVDINKKSIRSLKKNKEIKSYNCSILNFDEKKTYDLVFVKGVLIHINPKDIKKVYTKIYDYASKYIYLAEYYNPTPVKIKYRGHANKLFKRDFAGEMLDLYPELEVIDYGFVYHRDKFPQDDITWFLMKKN